MNTDNKDVAIIGMSCRFPGADNYEQYWNNLIQGKSYIKEIPNNRWLWEDYYGSPENQDSKTNIKWGGFIDNADKFDPLFFKISPTEAKYIDPQHRLILEEVWHTIEDAGYNPRSLSGKKVGVYVGVSKNDYAELMRERNVPIASYISTGTVHSIIANRVSYILDLVGKSEVVDTACSSFMVALNNAIRDIQLGFCASALVGGVNLIFSPTMYISHSKSGMLSNDGKCRTFDAGANGYVRAEGVGVVFVKPFAQAKIDGDNILGVVKGISIGHGGKSNFLTAPKASSQAAVISEAIADSGIKPDTVSYIEAHGTGTPLGDPIEINALKQVYNNSSSSNNKYCGLSAVKTNIGHLESAAGAAGLIKILLTFKYKKIPRLLNFEKLNPYIDIENSPFFIIEKNLDWNKTKNNSLYIPRRAGLSSFGMGGVNAHAILEECPIQYDNNNYKSNNSTLYILPISAMSFAQAVEYTENISRYLESCLTNNLIENTTLGNISLTLQLGREHMKYRVAFLVSSIPQFFKYVKDFSNSILNENIFFGECLSDSKNNELDDEDYNYTNLRQITEKWISGYTIDWHKFNLSNKFKKIPLPGYPFKKMRCWFDSDNKEAESSANINSKSLVQDNKLTIRFNLNNYFIRDHKVQGECVVPGVMYISTFVTSFENTNNTSVNKVKEIFWLKPLKVNNDIDLDVMFDRSDKDKVNAAFLNGSDLHCNAELTIGKKEKYDRLLDYQKIDSRCKNTCDVNSLYNIFKSNGLKYGKTFRAISKCVYNENEILCDLSRIVSTYNNMSLEPSMMDGVFQTVTALYLLNQPNRKNEVQYLPYYLECINTYADIPDQCFVYAKRKKSSVDHNKEAYRMFLCTLDGHVLLEFNNFVKRAYKTIKGD
jgi:acyl transferase domain-containing protein